MPAHYAHLLPEKRDVVNFIEGKGDYYKFTRVRGKRRGATSSNPLIPWRPQRDSNPRYRLERAMSWAGLDDGDMSKATRSPGCNKEKTAPSCVPGTTDLHKMSRDGFEPSTHALKGRCSTY